jgi:hypothetical protein
VNVVLVANSTPVDTSYQFIAGCRRSKVRVPSRNEVGVVEDIVGVTVTVAVTAVRVMLLQAAALLQHNKWWLNQYWEL